MVRKLVFALAIGFGFAIAASAKVIVSTGAEWKWLKGRSEASSPDTTAWRQVGFNDASFSPGCMPFWYGDVLPGGTQITDMQNQYTTIYLRHKFTITDLSQIPNLTLGYQCDDGFIAWINGVEVLRYNVPGGNLAYNASATAAVAEPPPWTEASINSATNYLVVGENVMAVHVFNAGAASSDLGIDMSLTSSAPDSDAPTVASKLPAPGLLNALDQITIRFSEPVKNANASDLLINGVPATGMSCGTETLTFTFPQPAYGSVTVTWAGSHGITDFATPANAFNGSGPGAIWGYSLVDNVPPTLLYQLPFANVTVRSLTQIQTLFSEPVTGVNASDLLINGTPAANVTTLSASNYIFTFPEPPPGNVLVEFAAGHGIRDLASTPNNFAGGSWSYTLDPNAVITSVRINEIMAANVTGLRDENGDYEDWVELLNTSSSAVSLAGWALTDNADEPQKWVFPAVSIPAHGFLIVFCSGKDRKVVGGSARLHTNFKLDPDGEYIALYNAEVPPQAVSVFSPYPNQRRDISYGYDPVDQLKYFQTATPGSNNVASTITGIVADTKFSHDRGFYDAPFSLAITSATPGVTIRYTLDGSSPSNNTGLVYSTPIPITQTRVVRAAAFKTGMLSSDVDCHTYLFLGDVIYQSTNGTAPAGWPATWGGNRVDYGMDQRVVSANIGTIKDDLKSIPTVSVTILLDDMFGASRGIYANPGGDGPTWERPCSLELIYPDDREGFQINCGMRLRGGYSRSTDNAKHGFRFFFRQEYGPSKLVFPMFGPTGAREFDKFDMRTMQNYSWSFGGDPNMICLRDVMSRDEQLAMGQPSSRGNFYHLYINGQYWGLYNSDERPEAAFAESYIGGAAENYDTIKVDDGYVTAATDGNMAAWTRLWQAATNGFSNDADYYKVEGLNVDGTVNPAYENLLDIDNLIDYMFVILYGGNLDAPISNFLSNQSPNNWYGFRDRSGTNGGFRFVSHDAEHTLLNVNEDRTGPYPAGDPIQQGAATALSKSQPQYIWTRLQQNAEFRLRVADHLQKHCFNGGALSVEGVRAMFLVRSNEIQRAIIGESARWGDARVATPLGRANWISAIMNVYNGFLGGRTAVFLSQMRTDNMWPTVVAPIFSSYGGVVPNGFKLYMTNNNGGSTIYYTLNGLDPRVRGGAVSPSAIAYTPGTAIVIGYPTIVRARVLVSGTWSPITEATFYTGQDFSKLICTEIMYNPVPAGADDFEFVELKNVGTNALVMTGMGFDSGITFAFTNGTSIAPGQFFVLGRHRGNLQARYPGLVVHGIYTGRLDNGGERLSITNILGTRLFSVEYKDSGRWPLTPDGRGFSLVSRSPNANPNPNNPSSWRASTNPNGSPGADDPAPNVPGVLINEALTHTTAPILDAVELYNPTASAADIGGWFLTDDPAVPWKYRIPDGTTIGANAYLTFDETQFNPTPGTNYSFALDSSGDQIYLFSGDANTNLTGYSHGFSFDAAPNGITFGLYVLSTGDERFVLQKANSPNSLNAGPLIGDVVIRQIMYHPPDLPGDVDNSADEYVELRNRTSSPVPLYDPSAPTNTWHLRGGIDFDFPQNVTVAATQSVVLVNFDPNDATARDAFLGKYGFSGARLFGPYNGKLDNSSDTVRLERPDHPDTNGVPYIWVDYVDYQDSAPWPSGPDGSGSVLQRIDLAAFGDDPINWVAAAPLTIRSITPLNTLVKTGTNATVTITVAAFGTGNLSYQWYLNGNMLAGETNDSITVVDVQFEDDGLYTVRVSDITGATALSQAAALRVLVTPVFIQPPIAQTVVAGGSVTLSATYAGSPPPFTNEWRQGSLPTYTNITSGLSTFYTFTAPTNPGTYGYRVIIKSASAPAVGVSHGSLVNVVVLADTDKDGIPDAWESANGLDPLVAADAAADSDGDTMTNYEEYIAGTDPRDPTSYLRVEGIAPANSATITFQALSNKTYTIEYRDVLTPGPWSRLTDVAASTNNHSQTVVDPAPFNTRFYRIVTPRKP